MPNFINRLWGRNTIPRGLRSAYDIAARDMAVMDALSLLGNEWCVFESTSTEKDRTEYLFIGPPGAFSMIARHHVGGALWIGGGVILVDGDRLPDLRDAEYLGVRLAQVLSDSRGSPVAVTPCLMLLGHRSLTVAKPPRRVAVTTLRGMRPWLKAMPRKLADSDVEALRHAVATQPELRPVSSAADQAEPELSRFRKVQNEVAQARHIRLTWVTASLVLAWLVALVGVGGVTTSILIR